MHEFAAAKINLDLRVGVRGADGYHDLQSLVVFADCGDALGCHAAPALSLHIAGPFGEGLDTGPDNLVLRAASALQATIGGTPGARLVLHKNLPLAAGLGGGSADAAAALRALNQLWDCGLSPRALEALGASLGADVPVCVHSRPRMMCGRGHILQDLRAWPVLDAVLVNPGLTLPTARVFKRFDRMGAATPLQARNIALAPDVQTALHVLEKSDNALTAAACAEAPPLADLLEDLRRRDVVLVRMCGSGPTCLVLTQNAETAAGLATELGKVWPRAWVQAVRLGGVV